MQMDHFPKKQILRNDISSNSHSMGKLLKKKRVGILKNPSILHTKNEQTDDVVSEQIFLLNLSKNEPITRKKTLKNFRKSFFEEDQYERKLPNILKKQASLKEILISTKKLRIGFEQQKLRYKPCVITEFWSEKYYRSLFKHSKLEVLEKDTEKENIWRFVKQKAQITKNEKNDYFPALFSDRDVQNQLERLPSLHETKVFSQQDSKRGDLSKSHSISKASTDKSRFKSLEKSEQKNFLAETSFSINQIINECDDNQKEFKTMREKILKGLDEKKEKKRMNVENEKLEETRRILDTYFTKKNKSKSVYC